MTQHCAVLDIGKTNVKIHVIDEDLRSCFHRSCANKVIQQGIYPHFDIHALWRWIRGTLSEVAGEYHIDAISITTHGATAALVHRDAGESGLVMPVMDYEFDGVASESDYNQVRPPFEETFSPALPAGLNLGRQLFWQQRYFSHAFDQAQHILPYPQYWAWRLTGVPVAEVTSWGCHTDLWAPAKRDYSALVDSLGLRDKLPPMVPADTMIGTIREAIAEQTGLSPECRVYAGVHDSNASYLRYLQRDSKTPFTVISTGTWVISFSSSAGLGCLREHRDMLANVDVQGNAVPCARFMGGREFDILCQRTGSKPGDEFSTDQLQQLIDERVLALPDFSEGSGPFGGRSAEVRGRASSGPALASLYCALMADYELDLLGAEGDVIIEGAWLKNPLLCDLLAQLRPQQNIFISTDDTGTVSGAAQLAFGMSSPEPQLAPVTTTELNGLAAYRDLWRAALPSAN